MVYFFDAAIYSRLLPYEVTVCEKQAWLSVGEALKPSFVHNLILTFI